MLKATERWLVQVDYDLETAGHMVTTGRYIYAIFMCHLALEKMLKAVISEETQTLPPRTHNLIDLARRAKLAPSAEHQEFIGKLADASVATRYPEDLSELLPQYPEAVTQEYLKSTKEVIAWIRRDPRLQASSTDTANN